MAYKQIKELNPASRAFLDTDLIEGQAPSGVESKKFTGAELRQVEKEERELSDEKIAQAVGLDSNLDFVPYSGTNYLDGAANIAQAVEDLDRGISDDAMRKAVYDPNDVNADAFNMDNMVNGVYNVVLTKSDQTILGKKTFEEIPKSNNSPVLDDELVNKKYVDDTVQTLSDYMKVSVYDPTGVNDDAFNMENMKEGTNNKILTKTDQSIDGTKTFIKFPVLPTPDPQSQYEAAHKKYVDSVALGIKGQSSANISHAVSPSGTPPSISNDNKYVKLNLSGVETPSSVTLGSMSAKIFWVGTMAEYNAISPKDNNTIYYILE